MSKFLSIIIPRYDETEQAVFPLLASISNQIGIDFSDIEVIIVNDGGGAGALDAEFLNIFNPTIKQVQMEENRGPGVARQVGIDIATGDYAMFCDADDILHSVGVLGALIEEAKSSCPDMLSSEWLEEIRDPVTDKYQYITHQIENTWMHGKLIRRRFLVQNKIKFHEQLRVHEDSYFLAIAAAFAQRRRHIPLVTYVWRFRSDSITRRNNGSYTFDSFPTFIKACSMSHGEIASNPDAVMEYKIIQFVLYVYFSLHRPEWLLDDNVKYMTESEETFKSCMGPFWKWWDEADPATIAQNYNVERNKNFNGNIEQESLNQWVARMRDVETPANETEDTAHTTDVGVTVISDSSEKSGDDTADSVPEDSPADTTTSE